MFFAANCTLIIAQSILADYSTLLFEWAILKLMSRTIWELVEIVGYTPRPVEDTTQESGLAGYPLSRLAPQRGDPAAEYGYPPKGGTGVAWS